MLGTIVLSTVAGVCLGILGAAQDASAPIAVAASPGVAVPEATLFAFDDHAIPMQEKLKLTLVQAEKCPDNPVVRTGPEGSPDYGHAIIYGSVLEIDGKFRMWYLGMFQRGYDGGQAPGWWRPMCYAESEDGIHWTKPELGLVELNGNRRNNICLIEPEGSVLARVDDFLSVIYEPDDPDPSRRYKAAYIVHASQKDFPNGLRYVPNAQSIYAAVGCATSADGFTWRVVGDQPAIPDNFEVSMLYRFGGFYYIGGQQKTPWAWRADGRDIGRIMNLYRSPDFVQWGTAKAFGFARPGQLTDPPVQGQQSHMGAGVWNRGNVLVGLYGMWNDGPPEKPEGAPHLWNTRIDLGLVVSDDGIDFREPVPDFKAIPRGDEGDWDSLALVQGHAFANVRDRTYVWYGHWDVQQKFRGQEIGLATLRRDGFGFLSRMYEGLPAHFVTSPVTAANGKCRLRINVEGASARNPVRVELLDALDRPIPGYSGGSAAVVKSSGTRANVTWHTSGGGLITLGEPFAARVELPAAGDVRVYALYVEGK